ncbi:MAG: lactate utilization protein [Acidobacteria bacterium]|nr:lactate utilization protein [Acidobacteriota bacterium]
MSTDEAKNAIFDSIRRNLAASRPFDAVHCESHEPAAPPPTPPRAAFSNELLIENFRDNFEFVGGKLRVVADEPAAAAALLAIIKEIKAEKIAVSDAPLVESVTGSLKNEAEFVENAPREFLFESDLGITSAQWAIAETGTLVLESDAERHRLTSLVPPVHICLLEAKNLRQTLGEVLELLQKNPSRAVTFITGASRTSDIELTLAIGVHGPGEVYVILISDFGFRISDLEAGDGP